ncbi:MAG: hypothetical protein AB7H77_07820 [Bdellovibrionales bacterium]
MPGFSPLVLRVFLTVALCLVCCFHANAKESSAREIKHQILRLAKSFEGQGDPDFSKQKQLDALVARLLAASPQPPVQDRLPMLYGTWKQVWGPYDYREKDSRGVDPEIGVNEIYQSIFPGGYYYNISPLYRDGNRSDLRIGLLRGKFKLDDQNPNRLNVRFTSYHGIEGRPPSGQPIWQLAPLAENDTLDDEITIVPWLIVQLFFGSGSLDEVYTDKDLRIAYGSDGSADGMKSIYILSKVSSP